MINRILNDRGRFLITFAILHLHFEGIRSGATDTPTSIALKTLCAGQSICSPGRATALLATMRLAGLVRNVRTSDGWPRVLVPTHELIALHRARLKRVTSETGSGAGRPPCVPQSATSRRSISATASGDR